MRKALLTTFLWLSLCGCTESRQARLLQSAEESLAAGKFAEGAELLRRTITINPESKSGVKALYKLGFTQETYLRDFENAVFNYQEFIRLSGDPVSVYEVQKRIAGLYFEHSQDPRKATSAYRKLLTMNPDSLEADLFQFRIAQVFFRLNEFEAARQEFQRLIDGFPKSSLVARARFEIGNSYYMEGKYDVAVEALKQVTRLHPQSEQASEASFLMAQSMEHQERLPAALGVYESLRGRYSSPDILNLRISQLKRRLKVER